MRIIDADRIPFFKTEKEFVEGKTTVIEMAYKADVDALPTVYAERHGHWIEDDDEMYWLTCSECGHGTEQTYDECSFDKDGHLIMSRIVYPYYCGYCGAKMGRQEPTKELPTFVKVIRCKDCKYQDGGCMWCDAFGDDGFCSHGERKEQ